MGWPRRARMGESGEPVSGGEGQQGSGLLASHQACQEDGWFLSHGRGGVERGGSSCPPMGELSINLVASTAVRPRVPALLYIENFYTQGLDEEKHRPLSFETEVVKV